jgi:hypothetical protein
MNNFLVICAIFVVVYVTAKLLIDDIDVLDSMGIFN